MILSAQQLSIHFGMRPILQQADFYLEDHDKVGIVGLNGAGKSTGTLALSVPGLTTRRRIPQNGQHWSRASGTGSSIPPRKRSV